MLSRSRLGLFLSRCFQPVLPSSALASSRMLLRLITSKDYGSTVDDYGTIRFLRRDRIPP